VWDRNEGGVGESERLKKETINSRLTIGKKSLAMKKLETGGLLNSKTGGKNTERTGSRQKSAKTGSAELSLKKGAKGIRQKKDLWVDDHGKNNGSNQK